MDHHLPGSSSSRIKLCLFGAAPDTANLGVSALFLSVLNAMAERFPAAAVTVFDHGRGVREDEIRLGTQPFRFTRCGANLSRRYYRRDSLLNMRVSAALGGLANPGVRAMAEANAVLDISGGDSFADLYGNKRFQGMTQTKRLALSLGTPLVLLPQTYGPFDQPKALQVAREIVRGASMAWARDRHSFETLKELLGEHFNADRHCLGVDVAFALPRSRPDDLPERLETWIAGRSETPLVGFNVSGLIYNQGVQASQQFGFKADYRELVHGILRRFLAESDARILLVPHVLRQPGHYESDPQACQDVAAELGEDDRVLVLDRHYNSMEMKWVIGQTDFFCGTRMHSTIAGLSSYVPTAAIAYSKKTLGVFEACGQGACVTDPRYQDATLCTQDLWHSWLEREKIATSLQARLPDVLGQAARQNARIFNHIDSLRSDPGESTMAVSETAG